MLYIEDLNKLKIYKIKGFAIYFKYDKEYYMIHEDGDGYEYTIRLYKKHIGDKRKYKLEFIDCPVNYLSCVGDLYNNKGYNRNAYVYKNMDLDYFVKKMTYHGLCKSMYSKEKLEQGVNKIKEQIKVIDACKRDLNKKIRNLEVI